VARYLAKRLGVSLQFVTVTAASRVPLLLTSRIDAEISVTTPNKVRNEVVDFTYSYIWDEGVVQVRAGESTNYEDYINSTKVIGAEQGNGEIDRWKLISPNARFKLFPDEPSVVIALKKGDVDGLITNQLAAIRYAKSGGLDMSKTWTNSPDAIMIRENDSKWQKWLNWSLQRMWAEGTLQKIYLKWYGAAPSYSLGDYGQLQPRVMEIGKNDDPWNPLPPGFLDTLLSDKSYSLDYDIRVEPSRTNGSPAIDPTKDRRSRSVRTQVPRPQADAPSGGSCATADLNASRRAALYMPL
jgi:polar amino acid transport system substrate-binding protein